MMTTHRICALLVLASCTAAGGVRAQDSPADDARPALSSAASVPPVGPRRLPALAAAELAAPRLYRAAPVNRVAGAAAFLKRPPVIGALVGAALGGLFVIAAGERGNPGGLVEVAPYVLGPAAAGALIGLLIEDDLSREGT